MENRRLRIVIVGGVAGGATAAARAARVNPHAEVIVLEKGPVVSFANCGLPYHLGGEIAERSKLLVASVELFRKRFGVEVRTNQEVTQIDRSAKEVLIRPASGEAPYRLQYDQLILAPGAEPIIPDWCQPPATNVSTLWTLADMDRILLELSNGVVNSRAVVIGAGFVGLEVVEQLVRRGLHVTLLERFPQVLAPLDSEMAEPIAIELRKHGVTLLVNAEVSELVRKKDRVVCVKLSDGQSIESDFVVTSIGVRPRIGLAQAAGLEIGAAGGIRVNGLMQTSDPNIFAVGDAVEYQHGVLEAPARVPLAGPANRAGRIAGAVAAGQASPPMAPVMGTAIVRAFNLTAACTGMSAKSLIRSGIPYRSVVIEAGRHAGYFPGAQAMKLKLLYSPEGRILGAQCVGGDGVDKRIDVIATAMNFRGTVEDLAGLDLAYAPPFGSAKDPVHMAAFVATNDLLGSPTVLDTFADLDGYQVVDVRESSELAKLPLPNAIHIPVDQIRSRWNELDASRPTVTVCHSGKRAHVAACFLRGQGFRVVNLSGGMSVRSLTAGVNLR